MSWKFIHPFTARFVGPTACGKTTFLKEIIDQQLITPWPRKIIYFYGSSWQTGTFDYLKSIHNVIFVKGFDDSIIAENDSGENILIICDDLVLEMRDSESAANLFMRGSHHLNLSVILIEQTLFPKGKQSVSMKTNTHYTVIFKCPSDALGVATLGRQMFPSRGGGGGACGARGGGKGNVLVEAFHDSTKEPFSYLIVDSKQSTPDCLRLVSKITSMDKFPVVYLPNYKDVQKTIDEFNSNQ